MLCKGDSMGVFQLEGGPMRSLMRSLAPTTFDDVAALVALYRPGPMAANMHRDYADRKNGRQTVTYLHPDLEEILGDTYGLMIYQESVMRVAQKIAGYDLAEADNLRKACGKKIRALIQAEREKFVAGCVATGYDESLGTAPVRHHRALRRLRLQQVPRLRLRVHRLPDGVAEGPLPGRVPGQPAHLGQGQQGQDRGVPRRVPVAGHRGAGPRRQPLAGRVRRRLLRRPGGPRRARAAARAPSPSGWPPCATWARGWSALIVAERERNGPFVDFYDFCQRVDPQVLNKRTIESLIKAGGFDSLGHPRRGLCLVFEDIVDRTLERRREHDAGVVSLFASLEPETVGQATGFADTRIPIPDTEFDKSQRLAFEKEMLGLYISDHPLMGLEGSLARLTDCTLAELRDTDPDAGRRRSAPGPATAGRARSAWSAGWSPS